MGYFLQHQIKDINSKLAELSGSEKTAYLNNQLKLAENDIECYYKFFKIFPLSKNKQSFKGCQNFIDHLRNYSFYADEKIKLVYPPALRFLFYNLIKAVVIVRYTILINREKKQLVKFIKEKIKGLESIENITGIIDPAKTLKENTSGQIQDDTLVLLPTNPVYFIKPENIDYENLKMLVNYQLATYNGGYSSVRNIIDNLDLNKKIIALNMMKIDLIRLTEAMDINESDLAVFNWAYILHKNNSPELIYIINQHYEICRFIDKESRTDEKATIEDMLFGIKIQQTEYLKLLDFIEKDLKIFELQRMFSIENAVKNEKPKKQKSKSSSNQRKKKEREKIIWFGSDVQLIDLFFLLRKDSLLAEYDDESILPHFDVKGEFTADISKVIKLKSDHFFWFGADNDFALLIDELAKTKLISDRNKYKLFGNHFQNSRSQPFKGLAQKHYNKKSFNKTNEKIPEIVKKLLPGK